VKDSSDEADVERLNQMTEQERDEELAKRRNNGGGEKRQRTTENENSTPYKTHRLESEIAYAMGIVFDEMARMRANLGLVQSELMAQRSEIRALHTLTAQAGIPLVPPTADAMMPPRDVVARKGLTKLREETARHIERAETVAASAQGDVQTIERRLSKIAENITGVANQVQDALANASEAKQQVKDTDARLNTWEASVSRYVEYNDGRVDAIAQRLNEPNEGKTGAAAAAAHQA